MIKELKLKFILNNMVLLGFVITVILIALCAAAYFSEEARITDALESSFFELGSSEQFPPDHGMKHQDSPYLNIFTVIVNESGEIVYCSDTDYDEQTIAEATQKALSASDSKGIVSHRTFSYMKIERKTLVAISFASRDHLNDRLSESISHSLVAMLVSFAVFFYVSKRLADMAVAPVEKAWEQQKQFIADASHDLKTPLTVIMANNNIVASHKEESVNSQMKWIESTSEEASRMSDLVNKMLELAKSEGTREELKISEVNVSELVENSILQFEVVAFEKNVTIESGIQPNIMVKTHPATFSKIMEILFDNAIKYSDENGKINVTLFQASKKVFFTINNKGEHIKAEELPLIFERFYRTNKEREVGGHGLGLSLAKKKCEELGHKISVESNAEDGTTFTLTMKGKKQ